MRSSRRQETVTAATAAQSHDCISDWRCNAAAMKCEPASERAIAGNCGTTSITELIATSFSEQAQQQGQQLKTSRSCYAADFKAVAVHPATGYTEIKRRYECRLHAINRLRNVHHIAFTVTKDYSQY